MKKIFCLIIFFSIYLTANSQLLWTISGNKLKKTSYLFGTDHKIPASFLDSINGIYKCFNQSEIVVGEVVINNSDATNQLLKKSRLPVGKNLHNYMTDVEFAKTDSVISETLNINLEQLSVMKPFFILMMYENEFYNRLFGKNDEFQVDSYFQIAGREKGKRVTGLETIQKQLEILYDSISPERQAKMLVESIENTDSLKSDALQLFSLYKSGNLDELLKFSLREESAASFNESEFKMYLDNRNAVWMKQIPSLLNSNSCFIAVGAMHLVGEKGLISLLRQSGYTVKPYTEKKGKKKK
jgi:uncharacterized protein